MAQPNGKLVVEAVTSPEIVNQAPFEQRGHDLLLQGVDRIMLDWINELKRQRTNSERVEQMVLEQAAKVKADINALFLLGNAAMAEAQRGDEFHEKLTSELDKMETRQ